MVLLPQTFTQGVGRPPQIRTSTITIKTLLFHRLHTVMGPQGPASTGLRLRLHLHLTDMVIPHRVVVHHLGLTPHHQECIILTATVDPAVADRKVDIIIAEDIVHMIGTNRLEPQHFRTDHHICHQNLPYPRVSSLCLIRDLLAGVGAPVQMFSSIMANASMRKAVVEDNLSLLVSCFCWKE